MVKPYANHDIKHIRKTSSAKSQDFKRSQKSRKSVKSRLSTKQGAKNDEQVIEGYPNLAYEIEYKNSDECDVPIQESSHDLTTSINDDGEYFSKC